MVISRLSTLRD